MDKKKILAIIAAVVLLFAVVILVVLTKSERPNENEKPSPTPVPTQSALPTDAPVPTAEVPVPTDAPTGTPAPTEVATPAPTDEPTPEPTQVAGATPTPMAKEREIVFRVNSVKALVPDMTEEELYEWNRQKMEEENDPYIASLVFVDRGDMDDGGFFERYEYHIPNSYIADCVYIMDTEEMPDVSELPKPTSPYTKDKANGTVRCAFSVQVGDDVVMEFWTNDCVYLKGSGRTWDFPEIGPNETELGNKIGRVAKEYFIYNYVGNVVNVTTGEYYNAGYDMGVYGFDGTQVWADFGEFFDSIRTIHIDKRITYIGKNIYEEGQKGLQYQYDLLTAVYD